MDAVRGRELAGVPEAIVLHGIDRNVQQARHLAGMRRDHHSDLVASHEAIRVAGKGVQRIGVEHDGNAGAFEKRLDERRGPR